MHPMDLKMSTRPGRSTRRRGVSLLETVVSLALFGLLVVAMFSLSTESLALVDTIDTDFTVQTEGTRTFDRLAETLRESGRVEDGSVHYPRVTNSGTQLEFRILEDLDGNGHPFDQTTGEREWANDVYTVRADAQGDCGIYRGTEKVFHLGRHVSRLQFATVDEDNTLGLREVSVSLETRKPGRDGVELLYTLDATVNLRN